MKKTVVIIAIIMVICIGIIGAFAADKERKSECKDDCTVLCETQNCENKSENCVNYEDADSDSVCDYYSKKHESSNENCVNYEDADNDRVCDNYSENCCNNKDNCANYDDVHNNQSYGKLYGNGKHGHRGCY